LLDEAAPLMATTPPIMRDDAEKSPDVLCPVLIHVHDPAIRERRRSIGHHIEKRHRRAVEDRSKKWIDLDENVLDDYILIDDRNLGPLVPEIDNEELPYPENFIEYVDDDDDDDNDDNNEDEDDNGEDTGSHGGPEYSIYKQLRKNTSKRFRPDFDFGATYPLANSHGNAYQDSSSHSKYTELYSEFRNTRNNLDAVRDLDMTSYAVANSHGEHGDRMTNIRNRDYKESSESDNLAWDIRSTSANYEMANSHSNYRVFYDSQTQHQPSVPHWSSELWRENRRKESHVTSEDSVAKRDDDKCETNTNRSRKKNEQESETNCDIEQCLVQIEESLLNIEQNLLHVQDLDIPELRNLLYKSPSIERSLYEVQDLLYADGIVPVIARSKSMSVNSDEEEEEDDEEEVEEEEVWAGQHITIKDNDDEDGNANTSFLNGSNEESSDTTNEQNLSKSIDDHHYINWIGGSNLMQEGMTNSNDQIDPEKAMNFVPNSLSKTPRRIVLDEVKENIRLCSSKLEESAIMIDYNLNSTYGEKKSLFRDKWHSRTNSLDENSIFQNLELIDKQENGKSSLQNIFLESTRNHHRLMADMKARSEGALQTDTKKRYDRRGSHEERLLQAVEATTEDFRKKLESFASQRRSILDDKQRKMMPRSTDASVSRSREKSPMKSKYAITTAAKNQDKENGVGKNIACDKRKRKKTSEKNQNTSENALEPSKLISLSLSLLLAALLQAVRCLTDLVEDAFRSISYDRNGLLQ